MDPVSCACGGAAQVTPCRGGFQGESARVECWQCGVGANAGRNRDVDSAVVRWNRLQAALREANWFTKFLG